MAHSGWAGTASTGTLVRSSPFSFVPDATDPSLRLDDLIMARLPSVFRDLGLAAEASRTRLRRLILDGAVSVAGRPVRVPTIRVRPGIVVTVYLDPGRFTVADKTPGDIPYECSAASILYEDEWLIAVNKPPGIPTEGSFLASRDSLHAAVRRYLAGRDGMAVLEPPVAAACEDGLPYLGLPHRLDRDTSGVVLFTKRREANAPVQQAFAGRTAHKIYRALAFPAPGSSAPGFTDNARALPSRGTGTPSESFIEVSGLMARISPKSAAAKWGLVQSGGLPSSTRLFVEASGRDGLVLRAEPVTGRTHQIRVHAAFSGLPLYGDTLYGGPGVYRNRPVPRVMLHAAALSLPHPVYGRALTLLAPVPQDFLSLMHELGL